jgi:hypothetical protein
MVATLEIEPERGKLIYSSELASQITSVAIVALAVASSPVNLRTRGFGGRQRSTSRVAAATKAKADARSW